MNNRVISITTAGAVSGLVSTFFALSYASLIFTGDLTEFLPTAIGFFIQGALLVGLMTALFSSLAGAIATVQDVPAVMYAVLATAIAGHMAGSATPEELFATVLAGLMLTSIIIGLGFWALGAANLGNLVAYIPFPVTAGFLAGVGIFLIVGAIQITAGIPITLANTGVLLSAPIAIHWLPAALFGTILFLSMRRWNHPLVLPLLLIAVTMVFQLWAQIGVLQNGGTAWTMSGLPSGGLWQLPNPAMLRLVDWQVLFTQVGGIGSILVVSSLSMLMNVSGLEMNLPEEIDSNRELHVSGWVNLLLGCAGSSTGYISLSLSALTARMRGGSRLSQAVDHCQKNQLTKK
jgi:SulP family sulfate permease